MRKVKHYALSLLATLFTFGCSEYDDTQLKNELNNLKSRVENLEEWCAATNNQMITLQGLVTAMEQNDQVTGITPVMEGSKQIGHTITFTKSTPITILHGKDGIKGENGTTPIIGVKQDTDGNYYWTVKIGDADETWMTNASGEKMRTTGDKGANGANGTDGTNGTNGKPGDSGATGHSPTLSVATFDGKLYWKVDGAWLLNGGQKVPATGEQGDAIFTKDGIDTSNPSYVEFTLADGTTKVKLQRTIGVSIGFDSYEAFNFNPTDKEIILALPATLKENDYTVIKAEITNANGTATDIKTRASSATWGVNITKPAFNPNGVLIPGSAKATLTSPAGAVDGETALLKVIIIDSKGNEHSSSRAIRYSSRVVITGVTPGKTELSLAVGEKETLTAAVIPTEAPQNVTWSSDNEAIATVSNMGEVTAVAVGAATITVKTGDGNFMATCNVTVTTPSIIGNFYYDDHTHSKTLDPDKTCVGIIFWQDPDDETKGKFIALDEAKDLIWSRLVKTDTSWATNEEDGKANIAIIKIKTRFPFKWQEVYPAFSYCDSYKAGNLTTGWYLPASGELQQLYKTYNTYGKDKFNKLVTDAGGIIIGYQYWSSTEDGEYVSTVYLHAEIPSMVIFQNPKQNWTTARPIFAF